MFTVLHKSERGVEMLYNADHVQFIPPSNKAGDTGGVHMLCGPGDAAPGVHVGSIKDGEVFVMNEKGATVARYWVPCAEFGPLPESHDTVSYSLPDDPKLPPTRLTQEGA